MDSNGVEGSWWDEDYEELMNMIENSLMEEPSDFGDASNLNDVRPVPELDRQEADPKPRIDSKSQGTVNERKRKRKMDSQPSSEKLKASNIQMNELIVGDWRRRTAREGDLTAKLYYNKRMLIWENLDAGQLMTKMVIDWSDITAIQAVMLENQPGILQIELGKPPLFYREDPPQPRRQASWHDIDDFTGGQALLHRRHFATFPPGFLDKHYENLLRCDERLFDLSQKPFPSQEERPYFGTDPSSSNVSEPPNNFNEPMTQQHPPAATTIQPQWANNQCQLLPPWANDPSAAPIQSQFNGLMTQQYLYPPPRAIAGAPISQVHQRNQFVPTPNMNGGAGNSQLTVWDEEVMHFPTANSSVFTARRMLLPVANPSVFTAGRMLLPVANPSPQPPPLRTFCQVVFPGQSYPLINNLVPPNHEMLRIAAPNMEEEIPRFAQVGPPFFDDNINHHYQMSGDDDRVVMLQNNGPSVRPPSPVQAETDDEDDLYCVLRKSRKMISGKRKGMG